MMKPIKQIPDSSNAPAVSSGKILAAGKFANVRKSVHKAAEVSAASPKYLFSKIVLPVN